MIDNDNMLAKYSQLQRDLMSSLRLKDVLDAAVIQITELLGAAKMAVFLTDQEGLSFRLMAAKGYSQVSLNEMRLIPFAAETLLKVVAQKRNSSLCRRSFPMPALNALIIEREGSEGQIAFPLTAYNLLIGAMLFDFTDEDFLTNLDLLSNIADTVAISVANAVIFGRSEYERERFKTLYQSLSMLSNNALRISEVLKITTDTALVLGNTPNCALLLYDAERNCFQLAAFKGLEGESISQFDLSSKGTIAGITLQSGRTQYEDYSQGLPKAMGGRSFSSVLALPLKYERQPLGVLELFSVESLAFDSEQIELLESFSKQVATALNVALTHESSVQQSGQDAHTGLLNRAHFEDTLNKEIERSKRHDHSLGLLLIDLDQLGEINDHFGEQRGDEVITQAAKTIKDSLRDMDIACRWGGEEFAVLLPETSLEAASEVAERLLTCLRENIITGVGIVTASIGVSNFPAVADEALSLLQEAEQALAVAKFQGRNRVVLAPSKESNSEDHTDEQTAWADLVQEAQSSILNERQSRVKSHLNVAAEFGNWLEQGQNLVTKESQKIAMFLTDFR